MASPTWYDVLGVAPDADPAEIKTAWRDATDRLEPGSGGARFRLLNEGADVLLDPASRAAYDEEIGLATTPEPPPEPALRSAVAAPPNARASARPAPFWLAPALGVLTVLALAAGAVFWVQHRHHETQAAAGQEAAAAAERALPAVLSYDYRHLESDRDQAARFLSPSYKKEYVATFDKLIAAKDGTKGPAQQASAVVKATVKDVGTVDADDSGNVAKVVVFVDQSTTKAGGTPTYSLNRLTLRMTKSHGTWLVDDITSF